MPTATASRTMHTLLTGRNGATPWNDAERACKHCGGEFLPAREEQAFCPGGECRMAWWKEHRKDAPHTCTCGEPHEPAVAPWLQEPKAWGQMFLEYCEATGIGLPASVRDVLGADRKVVTVVPAGAGTSP